MFALSQNAKVRVSMRENSIQDSQQSLRQLNWKVIIAIIVSTFSVVVERYQSPFSNEVLDHLLYFGLIPLIFVIIFRQQPREYGIQIGDYKIGIFFTLTSCFVMTLLMLVIAPTSDFRAYYGGNVDQFWVVVQNYGLDLLGWEFLFRGFLIFALLPVCGPYAIFLQAVPFTIAHIGKPEIETYSCIFGGAFLGWLAWRTRSFLYPFIIHWYLAIITTLLSRGF